MLLLDNKLSLITFHERHSIRANSSGGEVPLCLMLIDILSSSLVLPSQEEIWLDLWQLEKYAIALAPTETTSNPKRSMTSVEGSKHSDRVDCFCWRRWQETEEIQRKTLAMDTLVRHDVVTGLEPRPKRVGVCETCVLRKLCRESFDCSRIDPSRVARLSYSMDLHWS